MTVGFIALRFGLKGKKEIYWGFQLGVIKVIDFMYTVQCTVYFTMYTLPKYTIVRYMTI